MPSKKNRSRRGKPERRISVRAIRRDPPDLKKLSQALIALAMAQVEADAEEQHQRDQKSEGGDAARRSA